MVEPVYRALEQITRGKGKGERGKASIKRKAQNVKIILLSARGKKWNQQLAQKFSKLDQIIFVCPRYEGHDERIRKFVDEEISIGDYVLTGGELGAAVIMDSVTRLIPGVLGKAESLKTESHSTPGFREYPQYTRPEVFVYDTNVKQKRHPSTSLRSAQDDKRKLRVPKVLLTGHHKNIEAWREGHSRNVN
jgi:tRNA (guanine37-N1)-methyltransferase